MSLLFSKVKVAAQDDCMEFLVGGIPREYDDLEDWSCFEKFMAMLTEEIKIPVQVETYQYGSGKTVNAASAEIGYLQQRIDEDASFLINHADKIDNSDFIIEWSPDELFNMKLE